MTLMVNLLWHFVLLGQNAPLAWWWRYNSWGSSIGVDCRVLETVRRDSASIDHSRRILLFCSDRFDSRRI